jgi:hypothetical protein
MMITASLFFSSLVYDKTEPLTSLPVLRSAKRTRIFELLLHTWTTYVISFHPNFARECILTPYYSVYTNSFLVQLNMRYSMRQQLSAGPRVITTSIPPKHPLLNQQPTQSNSQSHSQSQSSTQAHSNFKSSANTHATSQPSSLTYSHPYAHPVYAPEHYKADVYRRARKEEEAGITFSDDNHLSLRDPERTFTSNSNMFELAPMPEIETVRPLPAPSHPVRYLSISSTLKDPLI